MKTLYFDIDGTVLLGSEQRPKDLLASGGLERAVRAAGVERLVCVGNLVAVIKALERIGKPQDGVGRVFASCRGAFSDESWFRGICELVSDPHERAACIDQDLDWWWMDDLAEFYCEQSGLIDLLSEERFA